MMKKTLIAAGVAVAMTVPAIASADVSLTAQLQAEIFNVSGDGDTANGKGWYMADAMSGGSTDSGNFSAINFRATHDLGNGLTGFAHIANNIDPQNINKATREMLVGLRGEFGAVQIGRMGHTYSTAGKDPLNATFAQARGNGGRLGAAGGLGNGGYLNDSIQYSNKFGPVSLVAAVALDQGREVNREESVGGALETTDKASSNHAFGVRVNVDLNPVEIWVAHTAADGYQGSGSSSNVLDGTSTAVVDIFERDVTLTKIGAEWKSGPFRVMAEYEDVKSEFSGTAAAGSVSGKTEDDGKYMFVAGSYTMGANTFMLGYGQFEGDLSKAEGGLEADYIAAGMRHSFNRQVSAHVAARQTQVDFAPEPALDGRSTSKETAVGVGMRVVF